MKTVEFNGKTFANWKDYFFDKFSDREKYEIEHFDKGNKHIENYRVTLKYLTSKTEIIFQIFTEKIPYVEIFDVHFNHPDSPVLTSENKSNNYGFDGLGSAFNYENLADLDDWINIPLYRGWTEKTTYFKGKPNRTDAIWFQAGKTREIPLTQNYLKKYGCLMFPIVPFIILWNSKQLQWNKDKITTDVKVIPPMTTIQ